MALVPYDSPISNQKILFYNTLFDENASCHIAFGEAYPCIEGGQAMTRGGAEGPRPQRLHHPCGLHGGHRRPLHRGHHP
ncbi:MAG: aminopeptidase [Dysosmobacter sp.]